MPTGLRLQRSQASRPFAPTFLAGAARVRAFACSDRCPYLTPRSPSTLPGDACLCPAPSSSGTPGQRPTATTVRPSAQSPPGRPRPWSPMGSEEEGEANAPAIAIPAVRSRMGVGEPGTASAPHHLHPVGQLETPAIEQESEPRDRNTRGLRASAVQESGRRICSAGRAGRFALRKSPSTDRTSGLRSRLEMLFACAPGRCAPWARPTRTVVAMAEARRGVLNCLCAALDWLSVRHDAL